MSLNQEDHAPRTEGGKSEIPPQAPNPAEAYESLLVPHQFAPWARDLVAHADPKPGERILDVACGTGVVMRSVVPLVGPNGRVVGVDSSPAMLAVARTRAPSEAPIEWYEVSAEALPLSDAAFDLVLCRQGLQFFADKLGATREMRRVLAPGGRVALSVWQTLAYNPCLADDERNLPSVETHPALQRLRRARFNAAVAPYRLFGQQQELGSAHLGGQRCRGV